VKGIVLLSGGLDSTLTLMKCKERGDIVQPIFVDYNQWSRDKERKASYIICYRVRSKSPVVIRTSVEGENEVEIGSTWGRSLALVGLAAMWAYTHGNEYDYVALGLHKGDVGPDCKPGVFSSELDSVLREATKGRLSLFLPVEDMTVEDIGKELGSWGFPFEDLYSCYWDPPCGYKSVNETYLCPGCRRKILAMKASGSDIPLELLTIPNGGLRGRSFQSPLAEKVGY